MDLVYWGLHRETTRRVIRNIGICRGIWGVQWYVGVYGVYGAHEGIGGRLGYTGVYGAYIKANKGGWAYITLSILVWGYVGFSVLLRGTGPPEGTFSPVYICFNS